MKTTHMQASIYMISAVGYGRLYFILALTLPQMTPLQQESQPETNADEKYLEAIAHVLAHIMEAKDVDRDTTVELVTYQDYGQLFIVDTKNVENIVGRV
jgi:hypothetical protein